MRAEVVCRLASHIVMFHSDHNFLITKIFLALNM